MAVDVKHDQERLTFVVDLGDGDEARLSYRERPSGALEYVRTFVPEEHRGQGIAEELVVHALEYARDEGREVVPSCPYVRNVMTEKRPEYRTLMASEEGDAAGPACDMTGPDGGET